jgi:PAS domain S-box-containing protein
MAKNKKIKLNRQLLNDKLRTIVRTNIRYNISVRFLSFVILVALLSGGIVGMVTIKNSRDYLRQQALQSNLNQANLASSYASNYIKAIEAHMTVFATRPDVKQAVLNGTAQQLQPTLAEFVQIQTPLNGVGIYDTNGIQLTFSLAGSTTIGQSFSDRDWYQGLMAAGKPYLGLPTLAKSNNVPVETFAVPILDDQGQIRAILTGGISLQSLSDALVNIGFSSGTLASMIDTRNGGLIIADNDPSLLLTTVSKDNAAVSRLISGQSGVIETTDNKGKSNLIGFVPVVDLPWGVMIVTPGSAAFAILNTLTQRAILFGGLILLAACILGVFLLLGIIRPLQHLVQETKAIGGGNLDLKVEIGGNDEIGDLSRSFSDMTAKLKNTMVSRDELTAEVIERKLAEQNLQSLTTYQGELLAAIPDIVMEVDNNKIYTWTNQAGLEFFGDDVIGKEASFYFEGEQDTYNVVKPLFGGAENTFYVESWQRRKDGQKRLLAWWCRVLKDNRGNVTGALSSAQDITERRQLEETQKASEVRYRRLFEAARDGILILDVETGTVVDVNPFMVEMLGFSREKFLGKKIWELGFLKDIIASQNHFEELKRNKYVTYENLPLETATGQRIQVEFVSHVYDVGNQQVIQCNIRDITERRRLEQEKEKFTKELAEKNTELERFTYTVSHDLKSPLVTIKTFLGYLKQDITVSDEGRIEKDMSFINGAADKMGKLLGELLEMSRVGRIVNPPEKVTFRELVKEAMGIVAGSIADGGVKVQVSDELVTLYGDHPRLVEIWQNLLENAVKFIGNQPSPHIDIGIERHDRETVFFVRDNGIGIDPKYKSKLFNLFEKINPRTEGTGMGLAITKRIVELYQGHIWVESKGEGQGSCFFFTLPGALKEMGKGVRT